MEHLPRSWLIMVSLFTILHGHGILAKIMARSWQDLGKATKELAMDLGKDAMASNTGYVNILVHRTLNIRLGKTNNQSPV